MNVYILKQKAIYYSDTNIVCLVRACNELDARTFASDYHGGKELMDPTATSCEKIGTAIPGHPQCVFESFSWKPQPAQIRAV